MSSIQYFNQRMQVSWDTSPQGDGNGNFLTLALFFSLLKKLHPFFSLGICCCDQHSVTPESSELVVQTHNGLSIVWAKHLCFMQQTLSIPTKRAFALSMCWKTMPKAGQPNPRRRYRLSSLIEFTVKMWQGSCNLTANAAEAKPISAGFSTDVSLAPTHH